MKVKFDLDTPPCCINELSTILDKILKIQYLKKILERQQDNSLFPSFNNINMNVDPKWLSILVISNHKRQQ